MADMRDPGDRASSEIMKSALTQRLRQLLGFVVLIFCMSILHLIATASFKWYPHDETSVFVVPPALGIVVFLVFIVFAWRRDRDIKRALLFVLLSAAAIPVLGYHEVYGFFTVQVILSRFR